MEIEKIAISKIKLNPNNPRLIKDDKFAKLVQSIKDFPEMLNIRPIVVNDDMIILGGNMRFKACKEAGLKEVSIIKASGLSEEKQREFLIKDNLSGGEWDWQLLNDWDALELESWGLDLPNFAAEVDYSILDDEDVSGQLNDMTDGVKKAIQIEFEAEHYDQAYELVKFWRDQKAYVGGMIMEYLKEEKEKI
jgi:ParB-like chromosome segregation protein Spo0J